VVVILATLLLLCGAFATKINKSGFSTTQLASPCRKEMTIKGLGIERGMLFARALDAFHTYGTCDPLPCLNPIHCL